MKTTALVIALAIFGLLATRMGRIFLPVSGGASEKVWEAKAPAAVTSGGPSAPRVETFGTEFRAPPIIPAAPETSDAGEIQAVRALFKALSSGDPVQREQAFAEVLPVLLVLDPDAAGYMAETWERGAVRKEFLQRIAFEWAKHDWMSSLMWAANMNDRVERLRTLTDISLQVSRDDALAAVAIRNYFRIEIGYADTPHNTARL